MASTFVPRNRTAVHSLSDESNKPEGEAVIINFLSPNSGSSSNVADGEQMVRTLLGKPSIAVFSFRNGVLHMQWGATRFYKFNHPEDNKLLMIDGDITSTGAMNVFSPRESDFDIRSAADTHSPEDIVAALEADGTLTHLPSPGVATRGSTAPPVIQVAYRIYNHCPHEIASELMSHSGSLTPRKYFLDIYTTLDTDEKKKKWEPITQIMQVAVMEAPGGGGKSVIDVVTTPPLVRLDESVVTWMNTKVSEVIPERRDSGMAAGIQTLNGTLAQGFSKMEEQSAEARAAQQAAQQQKEEEKKKKQTLAYKLGDVVTANLLRMLGVESEADLPEGSVWKRFAAMEKSTAESFRQALEETVNEKARLLGESEAVPHISLPMATGIMNGLFYKSDLEDPGSGWFVNFLLYGKAVIDFAKSQTTASRAADSSHVTLTPSDASKLMKFKTLLPSNYEAVRNVHRMYLVALAVFPSTHNFLAHLKAIKQKWENHYDTVNNCVLNNTSLDASKGILVLEYFTIKLNRYWKGIYAGSITGTLECPSKLFEKLEDQEPWLPQFKPSYLKRLGLADFNGATGSSWLENMLDGGETAVRHAGGRGDGGRAEPGATRGGGGLSTQKKPEEEGRDDVGTTVRPPEGQYNSVLFGKYRDRKKNGKEIPISSFKKDAMKKKDLPPSLHGAEYMCLAWHVKGMCNSRCRQKEDHNPYSASQYGKLVEWCEACYPAGDE